MGLIHIQPDGTITESEIDIIRNKQKYADETLYDEAIDFLIRAASDSLKLNDIKEVLLDLGKASWEFHHKGLSKSSYLMQFDFWRVLFLDVLNIDIADYIIKLQNCMNCPFNIWTLKDVNWPSKKQAGITFNNDYIYYYGMMNNSSSINIYPGVKVLDLEQLDIPMYTPKLYFIQPEDVIIKLPTKMKTLPYYLIGEIWGATFPKTLKFVFKANAGDSSLSPFEIDKSTYLRWKDKGAQFLTLL